MSISNLGIIRYSGAFKMIGDIYILDKNLNVFGIVDAYKSCIWSTRYKTLGDCELYCPATMELLGILREGFYLARANDNMVCQIKKIELDTSAEEGNYLIVTGYDAKSFLDQRIVWDTMSCTGNAEDFVRSMVNNSLISPNVAERAIKRADGGQLLYLGDKANLPEAMTEQVTYKNVGEKVRDYCERFGWGYRFVQGNGCFLFELYKGEDKTDLVIFSDAYENLSSTKYERDGTNLGNVALTAGEGEGTKRARSISGTAEGTDRFEIYVDAKDISKTITYDDLTDIYPLIADGGYGFISGTVYYCTRLDVQIIDSAHLEELEREYPSGQVVDIDGVLYYRITYAAVADLPSSNPAASDNVVLRDIIYDVYLLSRGYDKLAEYVEKVSFEGTVEPDVTFVYKKDYFLGDLVTVENSFGISASARIVEVVEVSDDNGYRIEPKFEYIETEV